MEGEMHVHAICARRTSESSRRRSRARPVGLSRDCWAIQVICSCAGNKKKEIIKMAMARITVD
eukprot:5136017-Pyramimonas_sp.AAC.1